MPQEKSSTLSHLKAIIALPFMVMIVAPFIILYLNEGDEYLFTNLDPLLTYWMGGLFVITGSVLFVQAVRLFVMIGKGTLAPWDPTRNLVVRGLYRYMRNPMISGVLTILLAEALLFRSTGILIWAVFFFAMNHLYFILKEEPDLEKRFGEEYTEYKQHVPRWIPRTQGWRPEDEGEQV